VMAEEPAGPDLVALTRELAEAQGVDATMRFFGGEPVYDMSMMGLSVFEGTTAVRSFVADWYRSYGQADDDLYEIVDVGNGVVFAAVRETARPAGSPAHAEVHADYGLVVVWKDGKATRVTPYPDVDEARAAADRLAQERG